MISSDYMYASSAFQSEPMESEYLQAMDATEKEIVEKEDNKLQSFDDENIYRKTLLGTFVGAAVSAFCVYDEMRTGKIKSLPDTISKVFRFTGSISMIGYAIGRASYSQEYRDYKSEVALKRVDRLEDKIINIAKQIQLEKQIANKISNVKEIEELQKAQTFFNNRVFDYKAKRSGDKSGTHIMYQHNQFQRV